jgi:hypothetical protein
MVGRRFNFCAKTVPCKEIKLFQLIIFLQDLYNWLEVEFNPLSLCNKMEAKLKVAKRKSGESRFFLVAHDICN